MTRIFVYDGREFPDPDPGLTTEEVRQHMAGFFPELSNAETDTSKKDGNDIFTFRRRVGTKGGCEIRQVTPEEIQKFHEELPSAVFQDGQPVKFCHNQEEAERLKEELEGYEFIEEKLERFVQDMCSERNLAEHEIWEIIHDISQGSPRE